MRQKRIAVSNELGNIRQMLKDEGYVVIGPEEGMEDVEAVIISGVDKDLLGIEDRVTNAPVINADGRQPEEILYQLRKYENLH
ncbi:MAG: YkuS family protein [Syntrophothermus sp.]